MLFPCRAGLRSTLAARRVFSRTGGASAAASNPSSTAAGRLQWPPQQQQQQQHHHHQQQQRQQRRFVHIEQRLEELGITLPPPAGPRANYDVVCYDDETRVMYVSGHLPFLEDGTLMTGKITGDGDRGVEYGYKAARYAALNIVSTLKDRLDGDLDRIEKIQKVFGIVQSGEEFKHQHLVMDGASDTFMEIFGDEIGYHARSAIGTSTLPLDITVEVECIVKLKPPQSAVAASPVAPELCR